MTNPTQPITRTLAEVGDRAEAAVRGRLADVSQDAHDFVDTSKDRAKEAIDATRKGMKSARDYVSEHAREPGVDTVAAVGLGVLLGIILGRLMR